jgi:DNA polymerase
MLDIGLGHPHDLGEFREAARGLISEAVPPKRIVWHDKREDGLFAKPYLPEGKPLQVPAAFVRLAEDVICHKSSERLSLLYELLWRLTHGERELLKVPADPLVHRLLRMQKAVGREIHKMHAFVRFRRVEAEDERFVAWFEPEHHILERAAPFFVDRFAAMRWSILTPIGTLHWNGATLVHGDPISRADAPTEDSLEAWWRAYYCAAFNPARANPDMMRAEMPKRYWKNLPEAALIPQLLGDAGKRAATMIATPPTMPRKRIPQGAYGPGVAPSQDTLEGLAQAAAGCRRCPLFTHATQTVFGSGPSGASVMLVGEQPGDEEDLQGAPFVGPAGQLLSRALEEAKIERSAVYVTNAVKHFKFEPRGKRRIHKKPDWPEVEACKWWLERELALVRPRLVVVLGGTAGQAIFGRPVKVMSERGSIGSDPRGFRVLITVHPSMILRLADETAKQRAFRELVFDLRKAAG